MIAMILPAVPANSRCGHASGCSNTAGAFALSMSRWYVCLPVLSIRILHIRTCAGFATTGSIAWLYRPLKGLISRASVVVGSTVAPR